MEKAEVVKESQVSQLDMGMLKRRTLQKSELNIPLKIDRIQRLEFRELERISMASDYNARCHTKVTSSAERTNQKQRLVGESGLLSLKPSCGNQIISKKISFTPCRTKQLDNPSRRMKNPQGGKRSFWWNSSISIIACTQKVCFRSEPKEGKTEKVTPQDKNQCVNGKRRVSTGKIDPSHCIYNTCSCPSGLIKPKYSLYKRE